MPVFSLFLVSLSGRPLVSPLFFFNDTATTEIYTLSLHDALPIYEEIGAGIRIDNRLKTDLGFMHFKRRRAYEWISSRDRKSTRLNSSHQIISYAVFCLKKKNGSSPGHLSRPRLTCQRVTPSASHT